MLSGMTSPPLPRPRQPPPVPPPPPVDPLGRTSPHGCVLGFLRAAEAKDYTKAAQYLDGKHSPKQAEELTVDLKYLLDRGLSTSIDELSRSPEGNTDDQLRPTKELVGTVTTPDGDLEIMLNLVKRPGQQPAIWLFAQETLNRVPEAEASMHHSDFENYFPAWASRIHFLSVPLWRWALVLLFSHSSYLCPRISSPERWFGCCRPSSKRGSRWIPKMRYSPHSSHLFFSWCWRSCFVWRQDMPSPRWPATTGTWLALS